MDIAIRNPSGYCDHLYYPEYCEVCKKKNLLEVWWEMKLKIVKMGNRCEDIRCPLCKNFSRIYFDKNEEPIKSFGFKLLPNKQIECNDCHTIIKILR